MFSSHVRFFVSRGARSFHRRRGDLSSFSCRRRMFVWRAGAWSLARSRHVRRDGRRRRADTFTRSVRSPRKVASSLARTVARCSRAGRRRRSRRRRWAGRLTRGARMASAEDRRFACLLLPALGVGETGRVGAANRREIGHREPRRARARRSSRRRGLVVVDSRAPSPKQRIIVHGDGVRGMPRAARRGRAHQEVRASDPARDPNAKSFSSPTSSPRPSELALGSARLGPLGFPRGVFCRDPVPALDGRRRFRTPDSDSRLSGDTPERLWRCSAGVAEMPGEGRAGGARGSTPADVSASAPRRALAPLSASEGRRAPLRHLGSLSGCFPDGFRSPSGVVPKSFQSVSGESFLRCYRVARGQIGAFPRTDTPSRTVRGSGSARKQRSSSRTSGCNPECIRVGSGEPGIIRVFRSVSA